MCLRILVCGSGNSAHVLAGIAAAQPDIEVRVFTRDTRKAAEWNRIMRSECLVVTKRRDAEEHVVARANPTLVTDCPRVAAAGCDLIILAVPAFCHASYLECLAQHIEDGAVILGLPGQNGFEFEVRRVLESTRVVVMNFESLPWSCRLVEFGRHVRIRGYKGLVVGAVQRDASVCRVPDPFASVRSLLGEVTDVVQSPSLLAINLMSINACSHPPIMYGAWKDWDGVPLRKPRLFYHSVDEYTAFVLTKVSDEVVATSRRIMERHPAEDLSHVVPMLEWDLTRYGHAIEDKSNQLTALRTQPDIREVIAPDEANGVRRIHSRLAHRYLAEDAPFGLVTIRGIAELAGTPTPTIDRVLRWCQAKLGKQYLVDSKLTGADLASTRCPQRYGYEVLADIL